MLVVEIVIGADRDGTAHGAGRRPPPGSMGWDVGGLPRARAEQVLKVVVARRFAGGDAYVGGVVAV